MVKVILRGGLGNQMFQYAAGMSTALKNNDRLLLDKTYLNDRFPRRQITRRGYDLDIFTFEPKFTALSNISSSFPLPGVWLGLDFALNGIQKIMSGGKNRMLWGFYQGEKYFADRAEAVRAAFQFRHALAGEAAELAKEIRAANAISIHVRRGDYLLPKYQQLYGSMDLAYYERAIAHIAERVDRPRFFIFSDDIAWCRENIKIPSGSVYIDRSSEGPKASFHLELMSLCKHNIIANSSFSWWGAWLNQNPEKIVIGPARWQRDGENEDILPAGWIAL